MTEAWETERLEFCLDRWEREDRPTAFERQRVYDALIGLRTENPRPAWAAPIPGSRSDLWLGEVPGTSVVVFYGILDDRKRLVFVSIDTVA